MAGVLETAAGWKYDAASLGIPSPVLRGAVMEEPWNLGRGWVGFDFATALGVPVRIINDAAMQALGSYEGGRMLFLGLGSGLGTTLVDDGRVVALELAHLPYRDSTFEDICGQRGLLALGEDDWRAAVLDAAERLRAAVAAEYVMLGGGNVRLFGELPPRFRRGHNDRAFEGGFRLWADEPPVPAGWSPVLAHATLWREPSDVPSLVALFDAPDRAAAFTLRLGDLVIDYSKNLVTTETMTRLAELVRATGVERLRDRMFAGDAINSTEGRAVLHTALRNRSPRAVRVDGRDVMPDVLAALDHLRRFSTDVRAGAWTGYTGARIADVVNIGIGGSDLGPAMATAALAPYAAEGPAPPFRVERRRRAHRRRRCSGLDPRTTLFVVASKTFTTQETMTNAQTARAWFLERANDEAHVARHFVAVSTNEAEVRRFGIAPENMFVFWDWVGGRYSLWSVDRVADRAGGGLRTIRRDAGRRVRDGRALPHGADRRKHADGPGACWACGTRASLGADTHAVLPYEQCLHRFPAYLQQLDMESNGKRVDRQGTPVAVATGPDRLGRAGHERAARLLSAAAPGHAAGAVRFPGRTGIARIRWAITTSCCWPTASRRPKR